MNRSADLVSRRIYDARRAQGVVQTMRKHFRHSNQAKEHPEECRGIFGNSRGRAAADKTDKSGRRDLDRQGKPLAPELQALQKNPEALKREL